MDYISPVVPTLPVISGLEAERGRKWKRGSFHKNPPFNNLRGSSDWGWAAFTKIEIDNQTYLELSGGKGPSMDHWAAQTALLDLELAAVYLPYKPFQAEMQQYT